MSNRITQLLAGMVCLLSLLLATPRAEGQFGVLINGDWMQGETGWTRWYGSFGASGRYSVANAGTTPPAGRLYYTTGQGNHGWFQRIDVIPGRVYSIQGDWRGDLGGMGWAEVMLFSGAAYMSDSELASRIDLGTQPDVVARRDTFGAGPPSWNWQPITDALLPMGNGNYVQAVDNQVVVALKLGGMVGASVYFDNLQLTGGGSGTDLRILEPADLPDPVPPVSVAIDFTAMAHTEFSGPVTMQNAPALSEGSGWGGVIPSYAGVQALFKKSPNGQARGAARFRGEAGEDWMPPMCELWDPISGECLIWGPPMPIPIPSGWTEGESNGTLTLGTSASFPAGTPLELVLAVRRPGSPAEEESFTLEVSRSGTVLGSLKQTSNGDVAVPVVAGETIQFRYAAHVYSWYYYDRSLFFLLLLRGEPVKPLGACCLYDGHCEQLTEVQCAAAHGRNWTQAGSCEPNQCPPPLPGDFDFDGDIDRDDVNTFKACVSGPGVPHAESAACARSNFDGDIDVDQEDFGLFQRCYSGAGRPADPACAD